MEYRKDPFSERWVIIAEERAGRPHEFRHAETTTPSSSCPFCAGHEQETPREIVVYPTHDPIKDNASDQPWTVRVIPNKFPAVSREPLSVHADLPKLDFGIDGFERRDGYGIHEVIIESPRHVTSIGDLTPNETEWVFLAYQDCLRRASRDSRIRSGLVFKNQGELGGASIAHAHSQFVATQFIPPVINRELMVAESMASRGGKCIFCEIMSSEQRSGDRVIFDTDEFLCFAPFASRFPYEIWVVPKRHRARFEETPVGEIAKLARSFRNVMKSLLRVLNNSAFNFWIHSAPFDIANYDHYHWHIEIIPRINHVAGFEWGTECFINVVSPENAAAKLRSASSPEKLA